MSHAIELHQRLELRDSTGSVVGYVLPVSEFEKLCHQPQNSHAPETPGGEREQTCKDLTTECERLRAELAQLRTERDVFLKSLYVLMHEEVAFDKRELLASVGCQPTIEQVIQELEQAREN